MEFLDIKSGHTTYSLKLTGKGELPHFEFKPDFLICRLQVTTGTTTEATFEIQNLSEAQVSLTFENILELEGVMKEVPPPPPPSEVEIIQSKKDKKKKTSKGSKSSKDKKKKSSKGSKSSKDKKKKSGKKKEKVEKFGTDLNINEIYSLNNFYKTRRGPSYFKLGENPVEIPALSKKNVKLSFGTPELPHPIQTTDRKDKKGKKKGKKSSTSSKSSSKKKGKDKKRKIKDEKYYVTKYNILLGGSTFVKDLIIIGNFM